MTAHRPGTESPAETPELVNQTETLPLSTDQRRAKVASLLVQGHTQERIAAMLGVAKSTVSKDRAYLTSRFQRQADADIRVAKGLDLERLDTLLAAIWPKAMDRTNKGQVSAVRACKELIEVRARLLGLEAPQRLAQSVEMVSPPTLPEHLRDLSDEDALAIYTAAMAWKPDKQA